MTLLTAITTPFPFARWGLGIVGSLPIARQKRKYIFVVVDYFTKWVEVEVVHNINNRAVLTSFSKG